MGKKIESIRNWRKNDVAYGNHVKRGLSQVMLLVMVLCCVVAFGAEMYRAAEVNPDTGENAGSEWDIGLDGYGPAESASWEYVNPETGYVAVIDDTAGLLKEQEKTALLEEMKGITEEGNVAFYSTNDNPYYNTNKLAKEYCAERFNYASATVFVVDMDDRYLWIYSQGNIYNTITDDYAQTITDNVYTYASDGDYYGCAGKVFEQIQSLLDGKWIAEPMKWVSNALLAVAIALFANYFIVMAISRGKKPSNSVLLDNIYNQVEINNARADFVRQSKRYSPQSSGSSGGRSGGGRSSGGGGSRGGGGGHRF